MCQHVGTYNGTSPATAVGVRSDKRLALLHDSVSSLLQRWDKVSLIYSISSGYVLCIILLFITMCVNLTLIDCV